MKMLHKLVFAQSLLNIKILLTEMFPLETFSGNN